MPKSGVRWTTAFGEQEIPIAWEGETNQPVMILGPGAGSHMEQKNVLWLASLLQRAGLSVVRFNFLYRVQGKGMPDRTPILKETYRAVISSVKGKLNPNLLIIGGHSMGGRVASMIEADGQSANGLILFGYPLHPPNQLDKLRDEHLKQIKTPTLQISGTEDPLCTKSIMDATAATLDPDIWTLKWIQGGDHSLAVKKSSGRTREEVETEIMENVTKHLSRLR